MPTKAQERAVYLLDKISAEFPDAKIELDYDRKDPWQLLVAVVLSAQATDKKVNEVTPGLFKKFPTVYDFAKSTPTQVEKYIKSLGFFRNKAKGIVGAAKIVVEQYDGKLPKNREALEELPGVGPKSAAVIISNAFGEPAMPVDTHVGRVARRLGLSRQTDPNKVEKDLCRLLPQERWIQAHHTFIWHGRRICKAPKPLCSICPVDEDCPKIGVEKKG